MYPLSVSDVRSERQRSSFPSIEPCLPDPPFGSCIVICGAIYIYGKGPSVTLLTRVDTIRDKNRHNTNLSPDNGTLTMAHNSENFRAVSGMDLTRVVLAVIRDVPVPELESESTRQDPSMLYRNVHTHMDYTGPSRFLAYSTKSSTVDGQAPSSS